MDTRKPVGVSVFDKPPFEMPYRNNVTQFKVNEVKACPNNKARKDRVGDDDAVHHVRANIFAVVAVRI